MDNKYKIRNMSRSELDTAIEWAANEGWNPGLNDAEVFWQTDPKGFVVLEKEGEIIGSGSIVSYNGEFGFMGLFIIKKEYRGEGLGTELWYYRRNKLISRLNKDSAIGMDGVFDMQGFYAKGSFKFSHRNLRMEGHGIKARQNHNISKINDEDFRQIAAFDKIFFGFNRETFLKSWLNMQDSIAYKYVEGSDIKGYGVIRKSRKGFKIGPLFCNDYSIAEKLFLTLSDFAQGDFIYLDIPEINLEAVSLAKKYKMKECFGCARMYLGKYLPKLPYNKIFGVTTFELG